MAAEGWESLAIEESGGFAGLRRGCTVEARTLPGDERQCVSGLLEALRARCGTGVQPARSAPMPDAQTLRVHVQAVHGEWSAHFDTADLPDEAAALLRHLPPLRPLPY